MNQDQLKEILNKYSEDKNFTLIFSGKSSKKVNGLYYPDRQEIIIHNKNFANDNEMMYTALHELAHHIDYMKTRKLSRTAHGGEFPSILAKITEEAIENGDFTSLCTSELEKVKRGNHAYAAALKAFGKVLRECRDNCKKAGYPFSDVIERLLCMKRSEAESLIAMVDYDIPEELGGEFGRRIAKIKNPEKREEAATLKELPKPKSKPVEIDEYAALRMEKKRIEKTIESLSRRLEEVDLQLEGAEVAV